MKLPLLLSRNHPALPGTEAEFILQDRHARYIADGTTGSKKVLFTFDKRYSSQALSAVHLSTVGTIGSVQFVKAVPGGKSKINVRFLRRVQLGNVAFENELFDAEFAELPEQRTGSNSELQTLQLTKGVIAHALRRGEQRASQLSTKVGELLDPVELSYLLVREFGAVSKIARLGSRSISGFEQQRILEINPAETKLRLLNDEYAKALRLDLSTVEYDPADPFWGEVPEDLMFGFTKQGEIDSDGRLLITCPSQVSAEPANVQRMNVAAAQGKWGVYSKVISDVELSQDIAEHDKPFLWKTYILSKELPSDKWTQKIASAKEFSILVESGVILVVPQAISELNRLSESLAISREGIAELSLAEKTFQYLQIDTGGDGAFPVRILTNDDGTLKMGIILVEEF